MGKKPRPLEEVLLDEDEIRLIPEPPVLEMSLHLRDELLDRLRARDAYRKARKPEDG